MKFYIVVIFSTLFQHIYGNSYEDDVYRDAIQFMDECGSRSLTLCLKEKALNYIERLPNNLDLGSGITIQHNDPDRISRQFSSVVLPEDATAREQTLDRMLLDRISDYISTHNLQLKLSSDDIRNIKRSMADSNVDDEIEEGRKKGGGLGGGGDKGDKKGGYMGYLLLFKMKMITLGAIAMKMIAMVAFKALLVAKIALTISLVVALKKLVDHKHHETYEVVAHPHIDDYSHYDRAFSQDLAYRGHTKT